jgi:hypothetical protein
MKKSKLTLFFFVAIVGLANSPELQLQIKYKNHCQKQLLQRHYQEEVSPHLAR